ncbi:hypothetical protein PCE1_003936 [Barthelona sp. PCE]
MTLCRECKEQTKALFGSENIIDDDIFELLAVLEESSESQVEQLQLCNNCMGLIQSELTNSISEVKNEIAMYNDRSKALNTMFEECTESLSDMENELSTMKESQFEKESEFNRLRQLEVNHIVRHQKLKKEAAALLEREETMWKQFSELETTGYQLQEDVYDISHHNRFLQEKIEILGSVDVLQDAFHIDLIGYIGSINGLRLGRLSNVDVSWTELNSAFGQCVLLLWAVSECTHFVFAKYQLHVSGSRSGIVLSDSGKLLPLFLASEGFIKPLFFKRNFSDAIVGLADCVRQLCVHFSEYYFPSRPESVTDPMLINPPHIILNEYIDGLSLRYTSTASEAWTGALAKLLENMAYLQKSCVIYKRLK